MRVRDPMKITLNDIALRVGVSKSLISMYLNNHRLAANIAEDTKRRIDIAVAETGYKPSFTARALASGKTRMLGMVVGGLNNIYFANLANAALDEAASRGYQMQLALTRWNKEEESSCLGSLLERRPDGIIYCPRIDPASPQYNLIRDTNYPMIVFEADDPGLSNVCTEVDKAFGDAVGALKARGHARVTAYLFALDQAWPSAFLAACGKHGVEPDLHAIIHSDDRIIDEILRKRPPALIFHEQNPIPRLLERLADTSDYTPDIIAGYCAFDKAIRHPRIIGGIFSESENMIRKAVRTLVKWAENGKPEEITRMRFPAVYHAFEEITPEFTLNYALFANR